MTILSVQGIKKQKKVVFGGFFALRILLPSGQRVTQLFKVWNHRKSLCIDKEPYSVVVDDNIIIIIIIIIIITIIMTLRSGVFRHADRFNINHIH